MNASTDENNERIVNRGRLAGALILILALAASILAAQPAAAKAPSDFFGVFAESPSKRDYRGMGDAGFGANRVPVNWAATQTSRKGPYNWTQSDQGVYSSVKHGMRPALVVFGTPGFVHKNTGKGLYGPEGKRDLKAWRKFSRAIARRYGSGGTFFDSHPELSQLSAKVYIAWNEQNSKNNWVPKPDPRAYGRLVKAFDKGISKIDRKAKIVLGGMYGFPRDSKSMKAANFLKRLYKVPGIAKHFDAVNSHPYGSGVADIKRQVNDLRLTSETTDPYGCELTASKCLAMPLTL